MPGLKVLYPATPYDAKGLMASALSSEDPVVFFESQRLYDTVETLPRTAACRRTITASRWANPT